MSKTVVFDVGIPQLLKNKLFNREEANRVHHTILPMVYLYEEAKKRGLQGITPDVYLANPTHYPNAVLYSHMRTKYTQKLIKLGVRPAVITSQESPLIAYRFYFFLKRNIKQFSHAFLFRSFIKNNLGIRTKLHTMFFPQPYSQETVDPRSWQNKKLATMVVSNKRAPLTIKRFVASLASRKFYRELYKERLSVIQYFAKNKNFDLYGINWNQVIPKEEKKMRPFVKECYRGPVKDKVKTLQKYKFTFAIENTSCPGYITEKFFDAIFAGSVPVYLGAPDITDFIPKNTFIDIRKFTDYAELESYLTNMTEEEYDRYIEGINEFIKSDKYSLFTQEKFANHILEILQNE